MLNQKKKEQYKSIKAPENLYEKVMTRCKNITPGQHELPLRFFRPLIGAAACFAVIIGIIIAFHDTRSSTRILISNTEVGTEPVSISSEITNSSISKARFRESLSIPIAIERIASATVTVSDGILQHYDAKGVFLGESDTRILAAEEQLIWLLEDIGPDAKAELMITIDKKSIHYEINKDSQTGIFKIRQIR